MLDSQRFQPMLVIITNENDGESSSTMIDACRGENINKVDETDVFSSRCRRI